VQDRDGRIDPHSAVITVAVVLVIIYGSLYPFHFSGNPDSNGPFRALINTSRGPFGGGDFLANVLLYLPFGLFSVQAASRLPLAVRILVVIFSGLTLSVCLELLQFYDEGRVSALADVYANTIGVVLGVPAGAILFRDAPPWRVRAMDRRPFVILLLSCWLSYRLFPGVPVIDLHKYWTAVKPLVFSPTLSLADLYRQAVTWLAVALLVEALFGTIRSRLLLPALVLVVLFARILILDAELSPAEVAGGVLSVVVWVAFLSRLHIRARVIAALFAGAVVIEALEPFKFNAAVHPFGWIPFRSFMRGSVDVNVRSFFEKVFTYGVLVWLIARTGSSLTVAVSLSGGLVLCLRLSQVYLPGRSAEITDPIMVMLVAVVMKSMGEDPRPAPRSRPGVNRRRDSVSSRFYESLTRNDSVQPVDMILVLAGKMERKHYGLELYRAGLAPQLMLSVGRFEVSKMPQLDLERIDELKSLRDETPPGERHFFMTVDGSGVRLEKANLQRCSTYGEALAFQCLLAREGARKVIVVSTDVHLRRVALTFATLFRGMPIQFLYCPVPARLGCMTRDNWWRRRADSLLVMSEMSKLAGYRMALSAPEWAARRLMRLTGLGRK
jgi:VanZ family protein